MRRISLPLTVAIAALSLTAADAHAWTPVPRNALTITSGTIDVLGSGQLQTPSAEMRAVERDRGRRAASALLRFRYVRPSADTAPLGSGEIRRQIGLKLRATDPCNLLYVMWRVFPEHAIVVSIKRNVGQTTSAQCGNRGYSDVARVPLAIGPSVADLASHRLEARTRVREDGSLSLTVVADGETVVSRRIPATQAGGLDGPVGVRSDNGLYRFRLSAGNRAPAA